MSPRSPSCSDDTDAAERLYELMSVYQHMTITTGIVTVCYGAASRYLGMLAATLGEFDKAEAHFEHALEMNERMQARPWLAHTKAEYALLLRRRGRRREGERAEALANEAWEIAAELDMVRLTGRLADEDSLSLGWTAQPVSCRNGGNSMPRYIIERNFAEQLGLTKDAVESVKRINDEEGVAWIFSFLSADKKKTYCLYEAPNPEAIRAAARRSNLPADVIIEVGAELSPAMFG